jgi:hypothetical protein
VSSQTSEEPEEQKSYADTEWKHTNQQNFVAWEKRGFFSPARLEAAILDHFNNLV